MSSVLWEIFETVEIIEVQSDEGLDKFCVQNAECRRTSNTGDIQNIETMNYNELQFLFMRPTELGHLQLSIQVVQNRHVGKQKWHLDELLFKIMYAFCWSCSSATFATQHGGFVPREGPIRLRFPTTFLRP